MKKAGFTMIELIFVIVILGILAAVAIPKLAATRNDAKVAAEMTSAAQALQNLGAEFTSQGAFTNYTVADANAAVNCFTFAVQSAPEGNVTIVVAAASVDCPAGVRTGVIAQAEKNNLTSAAGAIKTYSFGGTGVRF